MILIIRKKLYINSLKRPIIKCGFGACHHQQECSYVYSSLGGKNRKTCMAEDTIRHHRWLPIFLLDLELASTATSVDYCLTRDLIKILFIKGI